MDPWEVYVQLYLCLWKFKCCHNKIVKKEKKKKKQRKERKEEGAGEGERREKK